MREKEEALSQELQRSSQEKGELRGQLAEKVWRPPPHHLLLAGQLTPLLWASQSSGLRAWHPFIAETDSALQEEAPVLHIIPPCFIVFSLWPATWVQSSRRASNSGLSSCLSLLCAGVFCHSGLFIAILICIF